MKHHVALASVVTLVTFASACSDSAEKGGIDRSEFVAAFLDLREATIRTTLDSARVDSILAAHDVTEAQLRAYIDASSDDPDALAETWREVLDSIAARDSAAVAALADTGSAQTDTL